MIKRSMLNVENMVITQENIIEVYLSKKKNLWNMRCTRIFLQNQFVLFNIEIFTHTLLV